MKKTLFILATLATTSFLMPSCGSLMSTAKTVQQVSNIAQTANQLSSVLGNTLGLNGNQKSSLTNIFSDYITSRNNFGGLAKTNLSDYKSQLSGLNSGTMGKIQGLLTAAQYAKLLNIGNTNNPNKLLGQLAGGSSLTPDAISVLTGLLAK